MSSFRPVLAAVSLFACSALLAAPLLAQERPDPSAVGNGPVALSLGYATTAVVEDIHAIGWNPAGLALMERGELTIVTRAAINTTGATGTTNNPTPTGFPRYGASGEYSGSADLVEFVGAALPFSLAGRRITAAVAYRRFAESIGNGTFKTRTRLNNGRYFSSTKYFNEGGTFAVSPALGVELTSRIRLGVTANVLTGENAYKVVGPAPFRSALYEREIGGLAIQTGTIINVTEGFRVAAQVTLPHERTLLLDNDTTQRAATRAAPMQVAVGIAKDLSSKSRLSADLRLAPWSTVAFTLDQSGDTIASRSGVNDATSFHLGWERDVSNDIRASTLRLGGFVGTTTFEDLNGKGVNHGGVSVGQSWLWDRVTLDAGVMLRIGSTWLRSTSPQSDVSLSNRDLIVSLGLKRHF